jgi:hypothetical protein
MARTACRARATRMTAHQQKAHRMHHAPGLCNDIHSMHRECTLAVPTCIALVGMTLAIPLADKVCVEMKLAGRGDRAG